MAQRCNHISKERVVKVELVSLISPFIIGPMDVQILEVEVDGDQNPFDGDQQGTLLM